MVVRKVLLMATFLMFKQLPAARLATFLTIFSLGIHIAAGPFEDAGTDLTEVQSLVAQLITLVAGPVFVVLSNPESGLSPYDYEAGQFRSALASCLLRRSQSRCLSRYMSFGPFVATARMESTLTTSFALRRDTWRR